MILVALDSQNDNLPGNDIGFKIMAPVIYLARIFEYQHITPYMEPGIGDLKPSLERKKRVQRCYSLNSFSGR